ncbi:MAG: two-component sensor histidine kinase [Microbacterium sp. SCN 70-27]|uniref:sensor histidine kinase n=1 Tax=unclassified Microbacterium TaxID=2609290 RepID=UPI00086E60D5|nr:MULTISPECIES: ATP-binding protein [unclassified Microbacterium]MBN9225217.1 HAMP domain-containing protein [Microbacterium sp.]ODT27257.1 MAG: two-component sensor histidine kinase [Microbacterium sp. SCN 70-27]
MTDVAPPRRRRRWSLQTRLILTVVSFVALILVAVALATGTLLRGILNSQLDNEVREATNVAGLQLINQSAGAATTISAYRALQNSKGLSTGLVLIVQSDAGTDGAYLSSDNDVMRLSRAAVQDITASFGAGAYATVPIEGLGTYRLLTGGIGGGYYIAVGLPLSTVNATIAEILITVALVTAGGLLVLAAIIAVVIRRALLPLRSVAATASHVASQPLDARDVSITERVPDAEADPSDEIGAVGAALNTLLDHVDTSLSARQRNEDRMRAFVADASHELRTPLAAIRGYSELSLRALAQTRDAGARATKTQLAAGAAQSQQGLERIQAASLRMTTLVEDLLLLARLDEGKELVYGAVDLTRVVVDAATDAQVAGPGHEWVLEVPEEPVVVAGDATRLHQVIANLLTNARVHTPDGVTVTASVAVDDGVAIVRVADDGPGIDPAVADELFERFSRADTSRARQTGGTGLGLSIAKAIITAHRGTIAVRSTPGDTVFEVRLPARPAAPEA